MSCCGVQSEEEHLPELKKRSEAIDRRLQEDGKRLRRECKILLLGSENSWKTTIVKQMKIIHQNGYSVEERIAFQPVIYQNLLDSAKSLVQAMQEFSIEVETQENQDHLNYIRDYLPDPSSDSSQPISTEFGWAIAAIWNDPCMAKVLERSNEFYLMDSAPYFFEEASRIATPDYIPTEADLLHARRKTTGIYETRFTMGHLDIHMFDVGGQRSERKKWIHCFENVMSVIFRVALNEYDQVLLEGDSIQNRMMESLVLFESIVNSRWFTRTSIILFFNKIDLFKSKLVRSPLRMYFPDYGGGYDMDRAAKYLLDRFVHLNRGDLNIFAHLTQATDTSNIRFVFAAVKETIISNVLKDAKIL